MLINKIEADPLSKAEQENFPRPNNRETEEKLLKEKVKALQSEQGRNAIRQSLKFQGNIKLRE